MIGTPQNFFELYLMGVSISAGWYTVKWLVERILK